ncbi:hypothetical protein EDD53_0023 [Pacificibacter maritimus]|uniref:Transglycosylase-like protein with SLT domain n=1 Tax=Pacificibacter maritimus TaxID=762213 RepID=A0A3N4UKE3_9RHOB|nr:hypothetical protein [Pacificibacter maritimus]RPE70913.1 hypothetical protein EDD53_0023 [Pacificibacter maritimus]
MKTLTYTRPVHERASFLTANFLASLAMSVALSGEAQAEQTSFDLNYNALQIMPTSLPSRLDLPFDTQVTTAEILRTYMPSFESTATDHLKSLIASVEAASAGYDAVVHSAWIKPAARPTEMTIAQIYDWIDATPNQNHAIGRYQIIPATLKRLVRKSGLPLSSKYSEITQDFLADMLLEEAGYRRFLSGSLSQGEFMNKLARIWAGLPSSNGRSYYHGISGNRAVMSRKRFDQTMTAIFSSGAQSKQVSELLRF